MAIDGATGKIVLNYPVDAVPARLALSGNMLVSSCWKSPNNSVAKGLWALYQNQVQEGSVNAFNVKTAKLEWTIPNPAQYLLASGSRVFMVSPGATQDESVVAGKFILDSRSGKFIDCIASNAVSYGFKGARGGCIQGATTANGMFYSSQNRCRCTRNQVPGFLAFGQSGGDPVAEDLSRARPVEHGPAFGAVPGDAGLAADWPCYRHDMQRSGRTGGSLAVESNLVWEAAMDVVSPDPWANEARDAFYDKITPPVVAGGLVFVARINQGEVVALSSDTGALKWRFAAGGRVDSAPTIHRGYCLFGAHDGWVYALRAKDGVLAWRVRAAPLERRIVAFGRVESVWPVVGAVAAYEDRVFAGAGRSCDSDGGLTLCTLKLETGETVSAATWGSGG